MDSDSSSTILLGLADLITEPISLPDVRLTGIQVAREGGGQ